MLNAVATEALYSATYVDNYIESVDHLPDDLQRLISRIREIDVQYRNLLRDVDHYYDLCHSPPNSDTSDARRQRAVVRMHACLVRAQELGDEKMHLVNNMQELIDHKTRQMDTDKENLEIREDLQQLRLGQIHQEGDVVPPPTKQTRTQSPTRVENVGVATSGAGSAAAMERMLTKDGSAAGFSGYIAGGAVGGRATPNMETNVLAVDAARGSNKRSRRRNDTANNQIMEFGNESNSANEGGSNGGERPVSSRTLSASSQKKGAVQHQTSAGSSTGNANSGGASASGTGASSSATSAGAGGSSVGGAAGKKKKRKARGGHTSTQTQAQANTREDTPPMETIDPDEPTYCVCNQISFGEMILCDNDLCPIEWFHFSCVSLVLKPKGKWYCPNCRGDRPNVMKPKAQFLKELERYNKEKEEKT